jgi:hypothetical protein
MNFSPFAPSAALLAMKGQTARVLLLRHAWNPVKPSTKHWLRHFRSCALYFASKRCPLGSHLCPRVPAAGEFQVMNAIQHR